MTDPGLERLIAWGESQPLVRAMILTSTRAVSGSASDLFSDYDVILALTNVHPYFKSRDWLAAFGRVLVLYRDPLEERDGFLTSGYVVQFEGILKIDFSLWPVEMMRKVADGTIPNPELDAGYQVLLDKDRLTDGLKPATYRAYMPTLPTETEYREGIEDFFLVAIYVAKYLWRGDLVAVKHLHEAFMVQEHLRPMLEWSIEIEHDWSVKPGLYGRRLQRWLRPDVWSELQDIYTGLGLEDNWEALFKTVALMRRVGVEVGERLGYVYPYDLEARTLAYLHKVKDLEPGAENFD